MYTQKSFHLKPAEADANKKWYHVDATNAVVGRLATEIAMVLRGKNKPIFTPSTDCGDFIVVTNAEKVLFTGGKMEQKKYHRHSGYVGGIKTRTVKEQLGRHPELVLFEAVKGMMPKTALGRKQLSKLKIYKGTEHPHAAQNPEEFKVELKRV